MKKQYIYLMAAAVLVILAAVILAQALTIYPSQVIAKAAGDPIGIAPFTDRVDFGDVPLGMTVTKEISLENKGSVPNYILVFITGSVGSLVKVEPSSLTLEEGESQDIRLQLTMPASATPEKKFSGRVFILRLPKAVW
jgi:hypothetical protein